MSPSNESIIVVGCGVTGLSVATLLQSEYPSAVLTIIAAEIPTGHSPTADYASMWAGAHYRPTRGSTPQLKQEFDMAVRTAGRMKRIAHDHPEAGVEFMQGVEYLEDPPTEFSSIKTGDVYAGPEDGFRVLDQTELPTGVEWGCEYRCYCVNVSVYLKWLLDRFMSKGGRLIQHRLSDAQEAFEYAQKIGLGKVSTVVNCSGRNFDQDPKTKIIRGQTVLVKQQHHQTVTRQCRDGSWAFLIPRPRGGGTIVGGTKEIGDPEEQPRPEAREKLLRNAVDFFPDFVDSIDRFVVLKDNVGRRPWREGGYRFQTESVGPDKRIVHGYGAGGRGYELSWAAAEKIVALVAASVPANARL
ncbi:D-amino-acid oxidase [Exophiala viscosa]|uniref:D-amino-acid oxidase n=1 Tax=Exophiala viscosa TaxID=2486360 RepID=A0AAN6I800_9EURO|nr:D-amino-acid oxidase [Exophiala viscosa]KAI1628406.1 D-amino-acid oxidase [Exophiala viscosa]